MLKLRLIGIDDYNVLEDKQRIGRIRFADERMPHLVVEHRGSPDRWLADGPGRGSRYREGRLQGGMGSAESQDNAGSAGGRVSGHERSGRQLTALEYQWPLVASAPSISELIR